MSATQKLLSDQDWFLVPKLNLLRRSRIWYPITISYQLKGEFKYLSQDVLQALGGSFHQLWVIHKPSESRESFPICLNVLSKTCKLKQPWGSKQWSVLLLAWIFIANESKRCDWVGYCPCQMQYIQCSGNLPLLRCLFYSRYFFLNYKHNIF